MASTRRSVAAFILILACTVLGTVSAQADAPKRYALVIGNSTYQNVDSLPNAARDAAQIALRLSELDFHVFADFNVDRLSFKRLVEQFSEQAAIAGAETAVIYYAGHGVQADGLNHLVPVDATLQNLSMLTAETFVLDDIIAAVQSPQRQTIVFLDACRDNPLVDILPEGSRAKGLAPINTADNTFIAFATQPGSVSFDGTGRNSPFAEALLVHIAKPELSLSDLMIAVRSDVATRTVGRQVPWNQSSLRSQFYFNPDGQHLVASGDTAAVNGQTTGDPAGQGPMIVFGAAPGPEMMSTTRSASPSQPVSLQVSGDGSQKPVQPETDKSPEQGSQNTEQVAAVDAQADEAAFVSPDIPASSETDTAPETSTATEEQTIGSQPAKDESLAAAPPSQPQAQPLSADRDALIRPLQVKLRNVGCYKGAVDGDWGPLSRSAVKQYYGAKGRSARSLEPTAELLKSLERESKTVCAAPKRAATAKKRPAAGNRAVRSAHPQPHSRPSERQPSGPKISPTITLRPGGGIGVGFGF